MKFTYNTLSKNINKLIRRNRSAKTPEARTIVINKHQGLLNQLQYQSNNVPINRRNRFHYLVNRLNNWILNGNGYKNYKTETQLKNSKDQPAEIKDTVDNSHRIYKNNKNYYSDKSDKKGDLVPTQSELKIESIKQANDAVKDLQTKLKDPKHNRYKISQHIRMAKNDLNLILKRPRRIKDDDPVDNKVTPKTIPTDIPLTNKDYARYVITHSKYELPENENIRLDKIAVNQTINTNDPILKDLELGFTEPETAKRNHVSQSKVSYQLNIAINKVTAIE